jgi:hypothetical protein
MSSSKDLVKKFIEAVAEKYDIKQKKLQKIWDSNEKKVNARAPSPAPSTASSSSSAKPKVSRPKKASSVSEVNVETEDGLRKLKKADLVELCKERKLSHTGTIIVLIDRLLGVTSTTTAKGKGKGKVAASRVGKAPMDENIPKPLIEKQKIVIRRNEHNNFIHPETGIVFNNETKMAIGRENEDGTVGAITSKVAEQCKLYGFPYSMPENLDTDTKQTCNDGDESSLNSNDIGDIESEEELDDENDVDE